MGLRLHDHVSTTETEYGVVVLDERTGRYWQLSSSAGLVLSTLAQGASVDDAVTALTGRYDVGEARARKDIDALLDSLRSAGLVKR
ncbi:lasso peptide biosynthesis PqqD family chaperone [Streptomyces sp. 35G-GA-8]|uniref:lasso peptide biosynthesis PqqD family chaperone n=1 Tax=Streptomyces sp. 35G-GA-8 TaxID=2939434 RepID=UPI00201F4837|nr:lasso peptide biosynthesis PqqD family chaperone [Streptomyces sp. 35G-GA-8]MCL7381624.1 lasso peptide biosynthesis PqqD family chaperone [Streptomyces sp. 35G-GA-8]